MLLGNFFAFLFLNELIKKGQEKFRRLAGAKSNGELRRKFFLGSNDSELNCLISFRDFVRHDGFSAIN